MVPAKQAVNNNYKLLMQSMVKYEEDGLSQYCDSNYNKFVVGDPSCPELREKCEQLSEDLKNPFAEFHNWILGEISDVEAIQEAIHCRDKSIQHRGKLDSKKRSAQTEVDNLNKGKKTLKSLFTSKSGAQTKIATLTASIAQLEKDIEEMDKLVKMIEIHLGETVIPHFKETQMKHYYTNCQKFAVMEIEDSNKSATYWANFLENSNLKNA